MSQIVIPVEDEMVHTTEQPFCDDMTCPCHEDQDATQSLFVQVQDGLLTVSEAERMYAGGSF